MTRLLLAAPVLLLLSCGTEPVAGPLDYSSTKTIVVNLDYPDWIENLFPQARTAVEFTNVIPIFRMYIDGNDVGQFRFNQDVAVNVPATARSFQIRAAGQGILLNETRDFIDPVDISRFGANARVRITCQANLLRDRFDNCSATQ